MVKINNLEIENVKRVRAVKLQPSENGLTIIGGDNGQGKTSVLDAIAWALGGDKFKPSTPEREGSVVPPFLHVELLNGAELPLEGLSVERGELTYNGFKWDNMSGSEQLKVATAIVRKLNPECGFVLMDKLEQMDAKTLAEFGAWLEQEGLQVIATRVSTGGECSIIIEDGYIKPEEPKKWKAGTF